MASTRDAYFKAMEKEAPTSTVGNRILRHAGFTLLEAFTMPGASVTSSVDVTPSIGPTKYTCFICNETHNLCKGSDKAVRLEHIRQHACSDKHAMKLYHAYVGANSALSTLVAVGADDMTVDMNNEVSQKLGALQAALQKAAEEEASKPAKRRKSSLMTPQTAASAANPASETNTILS